MPKGYAVIEIFNPKEKNIEEKLKEIFISFLVEKYNEIGYNHDNWKEELIVIGKGRK